MSKGILDLLTPLLGMLAVAGSLTLAQPVLATDPPTSEPPPSDEDAKGGDDDAEPECD